MASTQLSVSITHLLRWQSRNPFCWQQRMWKKAAAEVCVCACAVFVACFRVHVSSWLSISELLGPVGGETSQPLNQDNAFCVTGAGVETPRFPSFPLHLFTPPLPSPPTSSPSVILTAAVQPRAPKINDGFPSAWSRPGKLAGAGIHLWRGALYWWTLVTTDTVEAEVWVRRITHLTKWPQGAYWRLFFWLFNFIWASCSYRLNWSNIACREELIIIVYDSLIF